MSATIEPEKSQALQPQLIELLKSGAHDEKMFALELLAQNNSPLIDRQIASLKASQDWHQRLQSAYYLLLTGQAKEADERLKEEKQPFVQLALLCAVTAEDK